VSLPSWDATPVPYNPSDYPAQPPPPTPVYWSDTLAAGVRIAVGMPVMDEAAERMAGEFDERFEARQRFREAWGMAVEDDTRRHARVTQLAADQAGRGRDWINVRDGDETKILKRMRALQEANRIGAAAIVTGPSDADLMTPHEWQATWRMAAAQARADAPRGVAGPT
jgi:hypothetical protein